MQILDRTSKNPSAPVESWDQIKAEALMLKYFMANGPFKGHHDDPLAIHHQQVADPSFDFFVVSDEVKGFKSWCIINLEILEKEIEGDFHEACMSWPHRSEKRVDRWYKVKVKYSIPEEGELVEVEDELEGLPAFIAQHESDHAKGINIYGK